ncbi:hypothetical protein N8T08_003010 [Aspergillus melleus]|uniref:Uncharacterized protein n=1 Tax=Aspergillus melleus TaxID=138277 RepID=A0ACC3B7Z1_9EURO|nr:hypothetical protein N8T08_003010 [Aspergillus melleus]
MGITILSIVVRTLVRRHSSKLKHLPRPKSSNWLYDHAFDIFDEPIAHKVAEWINERSYRQGLMHFFGLFGSEYLIPTNLEELTEVLSQRHYDYEKPGGFIRFTKRFWGHGIVSQEQDEHKVNRKTYLPVFNQSNINKIRSMLTKKSVQLDTLSWALYCLATYPDIQKMFREELAHTKAGRESLEEEEYDRLSMLNRHSHGGHQTISCNSTPPSQSHPRYDHQRSTSSQRHMKRQTAVLVERFLIERTENSDPRPCGLFVTRPPSSLQLRFTGLNM